MLGATVSFPFLTGLFGVAIFVYGFRGVSAGCASNYFGDSFAHARTRALLRGQVLTIIASSILLVSYVGWVTALGMIVLFPAGVYVLAMTLRFQSVMPRVPYVLGGRIYPAGTLFWRPFFGDAKPFEGEICVKATTKTWFAYAKYPVDCEALPIIGLSFEETERKVLILLEKTLINYKNATTATLRNALIDKGFSKVAVENLQSAGFG